MRRELQESRLELAKRDRSIERSRAELARVRDTAEQEAGQRAQAEMERFVETIGAPLVQFMTQAHLHRTGAAQVRIESVLEVGTRLVRTMRDGGVDLIGEVGGVEPFDPERHDPLSAAAVAAGRQVVIRMVGLSYNGRTLRKAGVEPVDTGGR
ncbi:hypothetical protein ABZ897_36630 [Nonomuraea sp. NPDC046802]|uniref:hypothetical protein n=1 Tax=Nonomuraea sp. NPDC046802 TaxID=3154919 RepID=UPI00340DDC2D